MENPFGLSEIHPDPPLARRGFDEPSEPLDKGEGGGELTFNNPTFETRRAELPAPVRRYADRLRARALAVCAKYGAADVAELFGGATGPSGAGIPPADAKEIMSLLERLAYVLDNKKFAPGMELEEKKEALYGTERAKLSEFFGRMIEVPDLPEGITLEKMWEWERKRLELHYLPPVDMSEESPEGWVRPDFRNIDPKQLPPGAMLLPGCWVLVDGRPKPKYEDGDQYYKDDEDLLEPVLIKLRKRGLIEGFRHVLSRFNVSPEELEKPEVATAFAEAMGLANPNREFPNPNPQAAVSLPRMIEFNVLGNLYHPEWGRPPSDCYEWFSDRHQGGRRRLRGGYSDGGGLAYVYWGHPVYRDGRTGFRTLGRFR